MTSNPNSGNTFAPQEQIDELIALYDRNALQDVLTFGQTLIESYPETAIVYKILAAANVELGNLQQAAECYTQVVHLGADNAVTHGNMGMVLAKLGRNQEAIASYEAALSLEPGNAEIHNNLGLLQVDAGEHQAALTNFQKAVQSKPNYAEAYSNLGATLNLLGLHENALEVLSNAIKIKPDYAEAHNNMGGALLHLGRYEEALTSRTRAVEIKPDYAPGHNNLGEIQRVLGQVEESTNSIKRALEIDPGFAKAHQNLSNATTYYLGDPRLDQLKSLYGLAQDDTADKMYLGFALAKAYDDVDHIDEAFECWAEANRIASKKTKCDVKQHENLFGKIKSAFQSPSDSLKIKTSGEQKTPTPVFIVGMPRSGTTLVEQILASHSLVHGAGELATLHTIAHELFLKDQTAEENWSAKNNWTSARSKYLSSLERLNVQESIITDKMPTNFQWIGLIAAALPEAKIVNLNRDPMAICWSIYRHLFDGLGNEYTYDLADIASFYNLHVDLMAFWRHKFPGKIYDVSYEILTENQEEETRKLLEFCGLEWEDQCLNFHESNRAVATSSMHQVREKLFSGSSQAWKKYERFLEPVKNMLNS